MQVFRLGTSSEIIWRYKSGSHFFGGSSSKNWKIVDSTTVTKWKRLFVNGCESKSPMSTATECLNSFQDGTDA
jgi:hypothetical protein